MRPGCTQISAGEHRVVESKPDSAAQDLRFHAPWPQLQALAQSIDLDTADDIRHKHVPYGEAARRRARPVPRIRLGPASL